MKSRETPLDLNTLPEDFIWDHSKQLLGDTSSAHVSGSTVSRRSRNRRKDERTKVYECRFCSLKFGKSQALGGHMNRHRQERETETLNQARQLVFSTDNLLPQPPHEVGGQSGVNGGYHYPSGFTIGSIVYPTRLFSGTSTTMLHQLPQSYQHVYSSLPSRLNITYSSEHYNSQLINDYFADQYVSTNRHSASKI
ncbi:unnamed protein product [Lactuca virosa]|uniref:C2H2-type domain-containing protein n=1 Tax=Lactuca virosa TaxID=75947 RepID=A0AAU9MWP8_9ASTR|nr:unnamed protein product [Lactuca virosa]